MSAATPPVKPGIPSAGEKPKREKKAKPPFAAANPSWKLENGDPRLRLTRRDFVKGTEGKVAWWTYMSEVCLYRARNAKSEVDPLTKLQNRKRQIDQQIAELERQLAAAKAGK